MEIEFTAYIDQLESDGYGREVVTAKVDAFSDRLSATGHYVSGKEVEFRVDEGTCRIGQEILVTVKLDGGEKTG